MSEEEKTYLISILHFFKAIKGMIEEIYDHTDIDKIIWQLEKVGQSSDDKSIEDKELCRDILNRFQLN